jgi:hypothetical protein
MDQTTLCLIAGPVISFVVSALKKISIIKKYPKLTAMFISAILGSVVSVTGSYHGVNYADIVQCILIQFTGAVGTHEAITNQVQKIDLGGGDSESGEHDFSRGSL